MQTAQVLEMARPRLDEGQNKQKKLFEFLFPGNSWDALPIFNPMNSIRILDRLTSAAVDNSVGRATKDHSEFMKRIDIFHPDKISWVLELMDTETSHFKVDEEK